MRKALNIALKDIRVWMRDVSALGILLGMPVVLILILGSALGGMGSGDLRFKVVVVNLDPGVTGPDPTQPPTSSKGVTRNIGAELEGVLVGVKPLMSLFDVSTTGDEEDAREQVAAGDVAAAIVIPEDFTSDILAARPAELTVYKDPGQETAPGVVESVVRSLAAQYSAASVAVQTAMEANAEWAGEFAYKGPQAGALQAIAVSRATTDGALDFVSVEQTQLSPDIELTAIDFYGVSMTAMFLMFGAMFGAFSLIKERREQTLARMLSTPTRSAEITAGKVLSVFALGMLQFGVLYVFTRFVFHVRWGEDVAATLLVAAAEVLAVTGLAVLIGGLAKTERGAGGLGPLIIQIQALIGGAFFTITVLPEWMQSIRFLSVVGWAMEGWSRIQMEGAGVPGVLGPVAALTGFAVVFFAAGAWLTGRRA